MDQGFGSVTFYLADPDPLDTDPLDMDPFDMDPLDTDTLDMDQSENTIKLEIPREEEIYQQRF